MRGQRIEVAAAVILRADGSFLLAQRPAGKAYAGYWEFPGGKIENGESAQDALRRELHEELGIEADTLFPWVTRDYDYAHAAVRLRFFRVTGWRGEPHGREAQNVAWQSVRNLTVAPLLPANGPILRALALPPVYGISLAGALGVELWMARLDLALAHGLKLLQVREKDMPQADLEALVARTLRAARQRDALVLVNGDMELACRSGADGIHLTSAQLRDLDRRPTGFTLVGASCHDAAELEQARRIEADFVVLGPVQATATHPDAQPLGWRRLAALLVDYTLPAYALGGLKPSDLEIAWRAGAHGISMMRGAWES
jgi:8-oxo-dGTP diphosphatase